MMKWVILDSYFVNTEVSTYVRSTWPALFSFSFILFFNLIRSSIYFWIRKNYFLRRLREKIIVLFKN